MVSERAVVSCITIFFLSLRITRSDIRSQVNCAASLVIVDSHFNLPQGLNFFLGYSLGCMRVQGVPLCLDDLPLGRRKLGTPDSSVTVW